MESDSKDMGREHVDIENGIREQSGIKIRLVVVVEGVTKIRHIKQDFRVIIVKIVIITKILKVPSD